ncbi:uncharacterized protein PHACADRAFT_202162 [Phanerochaete carnosa HHB-10118-sp]|uniref:F-box domain-containing protein n=1 Tax=Phanerochaete carnosa (strain HHB-10118-sp) TaxID=650164 RepID=K5VCZ4_PHACS|nr:uncharacterized protein PHACADRAFT_202162 [Phanerochaete carnosa HHB-10118-sp]EKM48983.1 hypothetical protein PHACADRAFT_202162 [Phanerochaete carnosa HHB-10118-sp]
MTYSTSSSISVAYAGTARNQALHKLAISQNLFALATASLSCSLNWSRVDLSNIPEKLARLLCEHSGNCALRFSWPVSLYATPRSEFAVKLCTENLLQVTELSLVATRVQLVPWVYEGSAPQIHEVFLQNADAFAYAPLILDCPLFRGETPHLHHLSLVGIRIPWATGNYRNLRTLRIQRCNVGCGVAADVDLCHIFLNSPNLETLILSLRTTLNWDVGDDALLPEHGDIERIPVRALRSLVLELPVPYAKHLLASIALPPTLIQLRLCLEPPLTQPSTVLTLLDPSLLPSCIFSPTTRLHVLDRTSDGSIQICRYTSAGAAETPWWEYGVTRALHARYALPHVHTVVLVAENGCCQDASGALPLLAPLHQMTCLRALTWLSRVLCAMAQTCADKGQAPWGALQEIELMVAACEPSLPAVLNALVAVARRSQALRTVNVTFRMPAFAEDEVTLILDMVRGVRDMGVVIVCRRIDSCQIHSQIEAVEELVPGT